MKLQNYTKEFKQNTRLAMPVITGALGHMTVSLIDDMMVGSIGPIELAASSLANSFLFIAIAVGIGFSFAVTPLIAETDGEKNVAKGRLVFQHSMLLITGLALILTIGMWFMSPILELLSQPTEVVKFATPYFKVVALSLFPLVLFQGIKQFSDGLSLTKYAMQATLITNVVNVLLNYLLIYGIWIFPELGVVGAAWGTLISRIVMLVFMFYILYTREKFQAFLPLLKLEEIKKSMLLKVTNIGFPSAMQMLFEMGLFAASVMLAGTLGAYPQAANQIAIKMSSTTFMISVGIGVATTIRVGNQKGLRQFNDLRRIAFSNFMLIFMVMVGFTLLFMLTKDLLPLLFTNHEEVISIAATLLIVAGVFQISDGLQAVILGGLRGLQDVYVPMFITFIAFWIIGFPVCYYLAIHTELKTLGIWVGLLFGLTTSAILLFWRFNYLTKKLIKKHH
ncbi:MAG: MATE family efflux transporter [Flavobacteriaceae bacterium]|nr:MATE family efflux transporter [Flavobacteriaceae bacterium]